MRPFAGTALILVLASACATVPPSAPVREVSALKGTWHGWVITPREFVPAVLEVQADGAFVMSGVREPVTRIVTGTFYVKDSVLRFEGVAGWRGVARLAQTRGRRTLTTEREDRRFPARFTASPA